MIVSRSLILGHHILTILMMKHTAKTQGVREGHEGEDEGGGGYDEENVDEEEIIKVAKGIKAYVAGCPLHSH